MNHNYIQVIACILLSFSGYSASTAQSSGPEFLDCSSTPDSLCVNDEGVRLPSNNQLYLGEEDPDATSCSVHVNQSVQIQATCGAEVQYEVKLYLHDTSEAMLLKPLTSISLDTSGRAKLVVDTEFSTDSNFNVFGLPYNTGCSAFHRIEWIVIDACGNQNSCSSKIYLFDCSLPVTSDAGAPYLIQIPWSHLIHLYAKDFSEVVKDDCARDGDFLYSLDDSTFVPDRILDPCSTDGFSIELPWTIWVADSGNDLNCDNQIDWLERNISAKHFSIVLLDNGSIDCWMDTGQTMAGKVITELGQGIKGVEISLNSPGYLFPTYITGSDGSYNFNNINVSGELEIKAYKNEIHKNGVSTLDLVKIQKHLLGIDIIENPYQLIAADANNSQNVSAIDLVELRKLILGKYNELPATRSWGFVPAGYVFPDPLYPWYDPINPWPHDGSRTITVTNLSNPGNLDFIGIKIGDVNGSARPDLTQILPRESLVPLELKTDQQFYSEGEIINVPIRISSDQKLTGFQFTLAASGIEFLNIFPGQLDVSEEHFAIHNNKMSISWFDHNTIDVFSDDVLFTLQLRATKSGNIGQSLSINSEITEAEIYLANEETFLPVLNVQGQLSDNNLRILSCTPNPWKEETTINFFLPEPDQVSLNLFDLSGREIFSTATYLKNGNQQYQLKSSDFKARGMLLLEIKTSKYAEVLKLIVTE